MAENIGRIVILHTATDGETWAHFLQTKLNEEQYDINTVLFEASDNTFELKFENDICVVLCTPDFVELECQDALKRCQGFTDVLLVALGAAKESIEPLPIHPKDRTIIEPQQTEESVRQLLFEIIGLYERHFCDDEMFKNSDEDARDSQIDDVFKKDDPDLYSKLPEPRQLNAVHKVIPIQTRSVSAIRKDRLAHIHLFSPRLNKCCLLIWKSRSSYFIYMFSTTF